SVARKPETRLFRAVPPAIAGSSTSPRGKAGPFSSSSLPPPRLSLGRPLQPRPAVVARPPTLRRTNPCGSAGKDVTPHAELHFTHQRRRHRCRGRGGVCCVARQSEAPRRRNHRAG